MVEGKVRIELRNVHTGRVDKIEKHNTFQSNVIQSWFNPYGKQGNTPYTLNADTGSVYNPLWSKLVGGLFLFDTALPTNPRPIVMPAGVKMVGNGRYGVANAGTPTELGSYNSSEEIVGNNAITQVYDFTTSQANGTIASVCLTSDVGGYIGYGNASGGNAERVDSVGQQVTSNSATLSNFPYGMDANGIAYSIENGRDLSDHMQAGYVRLYQWDTACKNYDLVSSKSHDYEVTYTDITVSGYNLDKWNTMPIAWLDDRYLCAVLSWGTTIAVGGNFVALVVDTQSKSANWYTVTNNLSETIVLSDSNWSWTNAITWIDKDNVLINASDGTDIQSYKMNVTTNVATALGVLVNNINILKKDSRCQNNHTLQLSSGLVCTDSFVYDDVNHTIYPNNGLFQLSDNYGTLITGVCDGGKTLIGSRAGYLSQRLIHNPLMLSTIANLDEAVTKTNNLTMKVVYTLTRSA